MLENSQKIFDILYDDYDENFADEVAQCIDGLIKELCRAWFENPDNILEDLKKELKN